MLKLELGPLLLYQMSFAKSETHVQLLELHRPRPQESCSALKQGGVLLSFSFCLSLSLSLWDQGSVLWALGSGL